MLSCPWPVSYTHLDVYKRQVYDSLDKLDGKGDVVIDFSAPAAVEKALPYCEAHKLPIVINKKNPKYKLRQG